MPDRDEGELHIVMWTFVKTQATTQASADSYRNNATIHLTGREAVLFQTRTDKEKYSARFDVKIHTPYMRLRTQSIAPNTWTQSYWARAIILHAAGTWHTNSIKRNLCLFWFVLVRFKWFMSLYEKRITLSNWLCSWTSAIRYWSALKFGGIRIGDMCSNIRYMTICCALVADHWIKQEKIRNHTIIVWNWSGVYNVCRRL